MRTIPAILTCVLFLAAWTGCDSGKSKPAAGGEPERSAAQDVIHTMTQYDKMKAGQKAKERVRQAAETHSRDLDEVSGE